MLIAAFFAIACSNVVEIIVLIFVTFKKRTGLYFWSLLVASWGIVIHAVGFLLKFFQLCKNDYVNITIITAGGIPMVIGQSVVLYSRLHLVVQDRRKIRWVLVMIVMGFFLFTKICLFGFSMQECIISGLYIWETRKMLQLMKANKGKNIRRVWKHLICVNILVILMDFTLIGIELGGQYVIETTYKSAMYSVKLKLEFAVLNQLRSLVKREKTNSCSYDTPQPYSPRNILPSMQNNEHAIGCVTSPDTAPPSTDYSKECLFSAVIPIAQNHESSTGKID
ncbi:integral membrane protein [Halenospora varia]|nr:integral membrane protein [Halenospora varia]